MNMHPQSKNNCLKAVICLAAIGALAGCAGGSSSGSSQAVPAGEVLVQGAGVQGDGGLLPSNLALTPMPGLDGQARAYVSPEFAQKRSQLRTLYIAPIRIYLSAQSPGKGIDPVELSKLTTAFKQSFAQKTGRMLTLVNQPRRDSLVLEIALTDVKLDQDRFHLLSITPVGLLVRGGKYLAGVSKESINQMTVEAIGTEYKSDVPLFAVRAPGISKTAAGEDEKVRLDQLPQLLADKAERLRAALLQIKSATRQP